MRFDYKEKDFLEDQSYTIYMAYIKIQDTGGVFGLPMLVMGKETIYNWDLVEYNGDTYIVGINRNEKTVELFEGDSVDNYSSESITFTPDEFEEKYNCSIHKQGSAVSTEEP